MHGLPVPQRIRHPHSRSGIFRIDSWMCSLEMREFAWVADRTWAAGVAHRLRYGKGRIVFEIRHGRRLRDDRRLFRAEAVIPFGGFSDERLRNCSPAGSTVSMSGWVNCRRSLYTLGSPATTSNAPSCSLRGSNRRTTCDRRRTRETPWKRLAIEAACEIAVINVGDQPKNPRRAIGRRARHARARRRPCSPYFRFAQGACRNCGSVTRNG